MQVLSGTWGGTVAGFKYLDFGATPDGSIRFDLEVDARSAGSIDIRLDDPAGPALGTVAIAPDAVGRGWSRLSTTTPGVTGVHAIYLAFHPEQGEIGDVSFFGFTREPL
jgi:hypothetical protein